MKTPAPLCLAAALALNFTACAYEERVEDLPPGHYERSVKSIDSRDVETDRDTSVDVTYDQYGNKKEVIDTKTTRDPPGLFNKTTTESREEVDEDH
jgi:hypothetical protein